MSAFANSACKFKAAIIALMSIGMVACNGPADLPKNQNPGNPDPNTGPTSQAITGGAVDGPVTNADVTLYKINFGATVSLGDVIDRGTTNNQAKIQDLAIPFPLPVAPYAFVLEFKANNNTKDLSSCGDVSDPTSCSAPVIKTMRTIVTDEMISRGQNIYATPLTTMTTNIALKEVRGNDVNYDTNLDGTIAVDEFKASLVNVASQVTSMLGFGLGNDVDIFNTPPLIDESTDSSEKQQKTVSYRAAITSVAAVVNQMEKVAAGDSQQVFEELIDDMADGNIDGKIDTDGDGEGDRISDIFTETTLDVLEQDPATLPIPNHPLGKKVFEIKEELEEEKQETGNDDTDTTDLKSEAVVVRTKRAEKKPDIDGDGKLNAEDAFPTNPLMDTDTDKDGIPDDIYLSSARGSENLDLKAKADNDDDNDGWVDAEDDFPKDASRFLDPAKDRDGDGIANGTDNCPLNANASQLDTDGDGKGDACSDDKDGDGITDLADNCPLKANPDQSDINDNGEGDACDNDIDGDGVANADDAFPFDASESKDNDKDGIGDEADTDDDNDKVADADETAGCSLKADCDGDGFFDNVDIDDTDEKVTVNFAPVALNVSATTNEDEQASGELSATDPNTGDTLTYTVVADSALNGAAAIEGNNFTFNPAENFNGTASFKYQVSDGTANSNIATVTIAVAPVNDKPVANAASETTAEDTAATGTLAASDIDGDSLNFVLATAAANGNAVVNADGSYTYTPSANFNGSDSFTFVANDGTENSAPETVTITVTPVPDAPVAIAATANTLEDTALNSTLAGTDADGDGLSFALADPAAKGEAVVNADGSYTYTPGLNFNGADSFSFVVNDGSTNSAPATVSITVEAVNDAPVAGNDSVSVRENQASELNTLLINDSDVEGSALVVTEIFDTSGKVSLSNGVVTFDASGMFAPDIQTVFEYTVSDGDKTSSKASVTVSIVKNPTPVAENGVLNVDEDSVENTGTLKATDDDPVTYALETAPANGVAVVNTDGSYSYTPNGNFNGGDSFTFTADDGNSTSSPATVNITVTAINDDPTATAGTLTVTEDSSDNTGTVSGADVDGDALSFSVSTDAVNGTVTITDAGTGAYTYTPNPDFSGNDSFSFVANDGTVDSAPATVNITVEAVNDKPVANAGTLAVTEDSPANPGSVSADDADGDTLSFALASTATNGVVNMNSDGSYTYTPNANFNGTDSFTFIANDGSVDSDAAKVDITVAAINDDPVAVDNSFTTKIDTTLTLDVLANDNDDADGDTLSISAVSAANGVIVNNGTDLSYTAPATAVEDTFTYTVSDGKGGTATASVTVNVIDVVDVTGVWKMSATVSEAVAEPLGSCDAAVNDFEETVISATQVGNTLTVKTVYGDTLTGTIDDIGNFSVSGTTEVFEADLSQPSDDTARVSVSDSFVISGSLATKGSVTGTIVSKDFYKGDLQCTTTENFTASFIYKHTGNEDYSGVYALEIKGTENGVYTGGGSYSRSYREGLPVEFKFNADGTLEFYIPNEGDNETVSNATFDPLTGVFSFELSATNFETDKLGAIVTSEYRFETITGILTQDPAQTNGTDGAPLMVLDSIGYTYDYDGERGNGGVVTEAQNEYAGMYGKRLNTIGHTRTSLITQPDSTNQTEILVGLLNAPLRSNGGTLYLQVMNTADDTELCHTPYFDSTEGAGDGRYFEQTNQPAPDMAALAFRGDIYSSVNCNTTSTEGVEVANGDVLPVRIIDAGIDNLLGTGDDTVMYSTTVIAKPVAEGDRFTTSVDRYELNVNGATASRTQSGLVTDMDGYFNFNKDIPVKWPAHSEGADRYQLRYRSPGDFIKNRLEATGGATSVTIPAGSLEEVQELRLVSIKQDANNAIAFAFSRRTNVHHGIRGFFNFEMGNNVPLAFQSFPVYIEASESGGICQTAPQLPFSCSGASIDFVNDRVSLNMQDGVDGIVTGTPSAAFKLIMHFKNSVRAEVTSPTGLAGVPVSPQGEAATTSARVASREVVMRTVHKSHDGSQRTQLNVTTPNPQYNKVLLKRADDGNITHSNGVDTGVTAVPIWNNTNPPKEDDFDAVTRLYTFLDAGDGQARGVIVLAANNSNNWKDGAGNLMGNVTFDQGLYKVVMQDTTGNVPTVIHHVDFPGLNASAYAAPAGTSIVLNKGTADAVDCSGTTCTNGNTPLHLANGLSSISWPVSSYPADTRIRIVLKNLYTGYEMRTEFMDLPDPVDGLSVLDGVATWAPTYDIRVPAGKYEISFTVGNNDVQASRGATVLGLSTANDDFSSSDRLYVTLPASGGPAPAPLTCNTLSGYNDVADGGLGAPIIPYSFADFETVIADCGTAVNFTTAGIDLGGLSMVEDSTTITFNADNSGSFTEVGNDPVPFTWSLEDAAAGHTYVVVDSTDGSFRFTVAFVGLSATPPVSGTEYTYKGYFEQLNYSTDGLTRDTGTDGEISEGILTQQ